MWKPAQLSHHQVHYVRRVAFCMNAVNIPPPGRSAWLKPQQSLLLQFRNELDGKEGIPASFLVHQLRQGNSSLPTASHGIGREPAHAVETEGRKHDFQHARSSVADLGQPPHQRITRTYFVVAVGPA